MKKIVSYLMAFTMSASFIPQVFADSVVDLGLRLDEWKTAVKNGQYSVASEKAIEIKSAVASLPGDADTTGIDDKLADFNIIMSYSNVGAVSKPLDISSYQNKSNHPGMGNTMHNFGKEGQKGSEQLVVGHGAAGWGNVGFEIDDFKAVSATQGSWENEWSDVGVNGEGYNVFTKNDSGIKYGITVKTNTSAWISVRHGGLLEYPVDVDNGSYEKLYFLAGCANNYYTGNPYLGVVLLYKDGSAEVKETAVMNSYSANGSTSYIGPIIGVNNTGAVNNNATLYMHEVSVDVDSSKLLDSIKILGKRSKYDEESGEIITDTTLTKDKYGVTIHAITATQPKEFAAYESYDKLLEVMDSISTEITKADYEKLDKMDETLKTFSECGIKDAENLSGISEIKALMSAIPKVDSVSTKSDFDKVTATITFNQPVTNIDGITIKKGEDNFTDFEKTVEGKDVYITFKNDYDYVKEYEITLDDEIANAEKTSLTMRTAEKAVIKIPVFYNSELNVSNTDSGLKVNVLVKNYTHPEDVPTAVTVALFSPEEEMISSKSAQGILSQNGEIKFEDVLLSDIKAPSGYEVRVFCLDSFKGMEKIFKTVTEVIE